MRELVLNNACLDAELTLMRAGDLLADVEKGIVKLLNEGHALPRLRLTASVVEVGLSPGVTLHDVLIHLVRTKSDAGRVILRLTTMYPIETEIEDRDLGSLVNWQLSLYPDCLALLLCASSDRIAVSISDSGDWRVDPLALDVRKDLSSPNDIEVIEVSNLFSESNSATMADRFNAVAMMTASASELWEDRVTLFPNLDFAPRVEGDLRSLDSIILGSAVARLKELDSSAAQWTSGDAVPQYLSKVTGESEPTMNKYSKHRRFLSSNGTIELFEKHARLPNGYRLHLREIAGQFRLEIGYIGPHLPIVTER